MGNTAISTGGLLHDVLPAIDRGEVVLDLEQACMDVVEAVRSTQKAGEVTLDIAFSFDPSTDAMKVAGVVKKTLPQKRGKASLFFITPEGRLTRMDTRQKEMFIDAKTGEVT